MQLSIVTFAFRCLLPPLLRLMAVLWSSMLNITYLMYVRVIPCPATQSLFVAGNMLLLLFARLQHAHARGQTTIKLSNDLHQVSI